MTVSGADIVDGVVFSFPKGLVIHRSALEVGCKAARDITSNAAVGHIRNRAVFVAGNQVGNGCNKSVSFNQAFDLCFILAHLSQTACFGDCHKACRIAAVISCRYGFQVGDMSVFYLGAVAASNKACCGIIEHRVFIPHSSCVDSKAVFDSVHTGVCDVDLHILAYGEKLIKL